MNDKENSLTFHNITQTMRVNRSRKHTNCGRHFDRPAKYRNLDTGVLCCDYCGIQEAFIGGSIEDLTETSVYKVPSHIGWLQESHKKAQETLKEYIRIYNCRFQKLKEAINDMQIKGLLVFNRKIQENDKTFTRLMQEYNFDRHSLSKAFSFNSVPPIIDKIDELIEFVQQSKEQIEVEQSQSRMISPITSKHSSPQPLSKNRSQVISPSQLNLNLSNNSLQCLKTKGRSSFAKSHKSQKNTGSQVSKTSTLEQIEVPKKNSLEDTPESVKAIVEQSGIRVTNNMATTMFEKVDICQSISVNDVQSSSPENLTLSNLRARNRYMQNQ